MTVLFVDADACPVRAEAVRVAGRFGIQTKIVCNGGIRPLPDPLVETVFVPDGLDMADNWIAERAGPGDVVVTDDIPLAARVVASGATVVRANGEKITSANIGPILSSRNLMAEIRSADPFHTGGGAPFGRADRSRFLDQLDRALRAANGR